MKLKLLNILLVLGLLTTPALAGSQYEQDNTANLAAIKTAVEALDNSISGNETQVDIVGSLPAGTNAIGKLAANSGVDIGDVDVTSIAAGDNNIGNVDIVTLPALAAGSATVGDTGNPTSTATVVNAVTLDDSPTSTTSTGVASGDKSRITFFVTYDETEVGGVSGTFTIQGSYDNSTYVNISFMDVAGGATPQTSEAFTADTALYVAWLPEGVCYPYTRVVMTGTGTDADDTILTSVYMATQE